MNDETLKSNAKTIEGYCFWLAEETFGVFSDENSDDLTILPISASRLSPFVGKTFEDAFKFLATVPLDKRLGRQFIAVLDNRLYRERDWLVIYRIDEQGEITSIPCKAELTCMQLQSSANHNWLTLINDWQRTGKPIIR